jgi:hypothetical protein
MFYDILIILVCLFVYLIQFKKVKIMANDGDYPFAVTVWNRLEQSGADPGDNSLKVVFTYRPYGYMTPHKEKVCVIKPGEFLSFSLYWMDESLDISLEKNDANKPGFYNIWTGIKARCELEKGRGEAATFIPAAGAARNEQCQLIPGQHRGGAWRIKNDGHDWSLKINKLFHDPEEENVEVSGDDI